MISSGTKVGRYTIEAQVGSGQHAQVYRARDVLGRPVALKLMSTLNARDRREAEAVGSLHHRNIVSVLDVFVHESRLCLVQAWVDGGSLETLLAERGGRLGIEETLRVGHDVAAALGQAHAAGILHRDIKPSNVLRDSKGRFLLVDFGAVGRLDPSTGMTQSGQVAGTPLYMSPEQVMGSPQSVASDLFGLGLLLFRCLHGRLPDEAADGAFGLLRRRALTPITVPASPLQELIAQCLELDPARRPSSADQVRTALVQLAAVIGGSDVGTEAPPPTPAVKGAGTVGDVVVLPDATPWSSEAATPRLRWWPSRGRRAALVVAGGALAFTLVLTLLQGRPPGLEPGPADGGNVLLSLGLLVNGVALAGLSVLLARALHRRWSGPAPEAEHEAARIVFGAEQRGDLTKSLMIEVEQLVARLRRLDRRVLGMTVSGMIIEYEISEQSADRQTALLNLVALMDKVQAHLAPWHVRHRDAITTSIAVVGCMSGLLSAVGAFVR